MSKNFIHDVNSDKLYVNQDLVTAIMKLYDPMTGRIRSHEIGCPAYSYKIDDNGNHFRDKCGCGFDHILNESQKAWVALRLEGIV